MGLYSALLVYCHPAFRLGSVFSWEDVITVVIRDLLSSSCPNELNKEASIITDLDCAEAGSDHLQLLDTFYHHRKYNLKNCHQRDPSKGPRKPTATPGLAWPGSPAGEFCSKYPRRRRGRGGALGDAGEHPSRAGR